MLRRVVARLVIVLLIVCQGLGTDYSLVAADNASAVPIGSRITAFELHDYQGRKWHSREFTGARAVVVVFLGTQCPLAKQYALRINSLEKEYSQAGIRFIAVNPNVQDSLEMMAAFARKHFLEMPFLKDPDQKLTIALGATRTPEACLVTPQGKIVYRGRIDDQYGIGYTRSAPQKSELKEAIDAFLANKSIEQSEAPAVGCLIGRRRPTESSGDVTYANQISRILQKHCTQCHREGDVGPMSLSSYEDVVAWSDMMMEVIDDGRMPPWHANPAHGKFSNDRSISASDRKLLEQWVASGTPRGDMSQLPEPLVFAEGWQLPQEPDVVVPVSSKPFVVKAKGTVQYQYFTQKLSFDEDKWIKAIEIKPGNRAVVHHILAFDRKQGTEGNIQAHRSFFAGYVPGTRVQPFPDGMAKRLPAGSELVFQVHYTPIGTEQVDQSHLGIVFVDDPSKLTHEIQTSSVFDSRFNIPPKVGDHPVSAQLDSPLPACELLSMSPHMHVRGKSFRYTALFPDGRKQILLDVPQYDFNWQTDYVLDQRLAIPAGTQILGEATFDNSEKNLNNPDPTRWVSFGEQTWEEMMIGYFHVAIPLDPNTGRAVASVLPDPRQRRRPPVEEIFKRMDRNQDGQLSEDEIPERFRPFVAALDENQDGKISREEFKLPN